MGLFDKIFGSSKNEASSKLQWISLDNMEMLENAIEASHLQAVVLFKHSTRCSISSMAKDRLERSWDFAEGSGPAMYYLDLISHRQISNEIAERFKVHHESPQLILLKNAEAIYDASHNYISLEELKEALA
jgi:bacillithiol system protein YtxJ